MSEEIISTTESSSVSINEDQAASAIIVEEVCEDPAEGACAENLGLRGIFDETVEFLNQVNRNYGCFPSVLSVLNDGEVSIELKKHSVQRAIDEIWVKTIEESLIALDDVIRKPTVYIEENDEVLPIEFSRHITSRSIRHLAQHTDYINKVEDDMVTPSKILNVFYDETIFTYENKFINTLINRLFIFINKRYEAIMKYGKSEQTTTLKFVGDFVHEGAVGHVNMEVSVTGEAEVLSVEAAAAAEKSKTLMERVQKLYEIINSYTTSDFVKSMGKAYVRPPIMRTNAILKNKNLKQCLALWQFIESYEDVGFSVGLKESAETVDESYVKELYAAAALQYVIFRHKIDGDFDEDREIESISKEPFTPKFISNLKLLESRAFNVYDSEYKRVVPYSYATGKKHLSKDEREIERAIDIALAADLALNEMTDEELKRLNELRRIAKQKREEDERLRLEEEARRLKEEEEARLKAEEEARRAKEDEDARRIAELAEARARELTEEYLNKFREAELARLKAEQERDAAVLAAAQRPVEPPKTKPKLVIKAKVGTRVVEKQVLRDKTKLPPENAEESAVSTPEGNNAKPQKLVIKQRKVEHKPKAE